MPLLPVDDFFNNDLTVPATFTPAGGQAVEIDVLFDSEAEVSSVGGSEFINQGPRATCRKRDVQTAKVADTLVIHVPITLEQDERRLGTEQGDLLIAEGNQTYTVKSVHPDSTGLTELMLTQDT